VAYFNSSQLLMTYTIKP